METALTAPIIPTKTVNALATPVTKRITDPTTLPSSWPLKRSNILNLYAYNTFHTPKPNPSIKRTALFLTHCSTKPNTDKDNATDQNSTTDPTDPNRNVQKPAIPTSNQVISSSNSSFSRGLVFGIGPKNSWDCVEIGSPVVKRYLSDEEERWYMWYYGRSSGDKGFNSIGLAVSSNGIHWERGGGSVRSSGDVGTVMNCGKDWWAFDTMNIMPCEVVIMSSTKVRANSAVYWLYYTGFSCENVEFLNDSLKFNFENPEKVYVDDDNKNDGNEGIGKIFKSLPGLAMSQDGRHWARIEGEHHSGALFDVGSNGEWDSMFIASPQVVFHGSGDLRMYYHSFDLEKGQFAIGMARSRDGIRWVKLGKIIGGGPIGSFDEFGVLNSSVVRNRKDGKYVMAYEGVAANGARSIGFMVSLDGLKDWRRLQDGPVLKQPEEEQWDNKGVGSPCLVQMDGDEDEWRLYYRGIGKGGMTGIGLAVSEGSELRSFRRWTGFHL